MKQFLRSFLTLLMLVVWASGSFAATTTIDFSSGLPNGWTKAAGTVANESYQNKKCLQLQNNTTIESSVFTTKVIKKIELSLCKNKNSEFNISYQIGNNTPIVIATNVGASMSKKNWKTFSFDFPEEAQVEGGKIIIYNKVASYYIEKITLTEVDNSKKPSNLSFPNDTESVDINGTFNAPVATLTSEGVTISGKNIKYTSSNTAVATVNESTGEVTIVGRGNTKITASLTGDAEYNDAEASYILTIIDPNFTDVTFDFMKPADYEYGVSSGNTNHEGDLDDNGGQIISNGVVITSTSTSSTPNRFWYDGLRVYDNSKLVISASGYKIVNVTTEGAQYTWTYNNNGTAVCDVTKATLTSMTVTMSPLPQVTFFENKDNDDALKTYDNKKTVNTTLTRTLVANKWNTFCLPFETEIAGTALEGATVKTIGTIEGNVINLVDAAKIEAGVPYLVMPTTGDIVNPTFKSVTISVTTPVGKGNDEYKFVGTYSPKTISQEEFGTIWGVTAEGKLAMINAKTTMKGLRAYFVFPKKAAAKLNFNGEATGINSIETEAAVNGKVYNLNGQYVGNSLNGLKKGIYVVNGKKVIK